MSFQHVPVIQVYFHGEEKKILAGKLALKDRKLFFEYTPEFIQSGLALSPFKLPLKPGIQTNEEQLFDGLFGVFNDSLPDGWGRLLLDRKLMALGINPGQLSVLDRLRYVGKNGMGALSYEPEIDNEKLPPYDDLDEISDEILTFQKTENEQFVDDLLALNGSSAGARPKILVDIENESWIIKFRSTIDPKDIGPIEYAYHLMAKQTGLILPEAKLFPSNKGAGYFGVKRFDRKKESRIHMHTLSGLLHADHRLPSLDYEMLLKTTLHLTKNTQETEKQFRAAVFNVLSHNRDDHAKNFAFLMNEKGDWHVSPAYDLTFSSGPSGEHCTMVMGEGKHPKLSHLLKLADIGNIDKRKAINIIDEVRNALSSWKEIAKNTGVSSTSIKLIQTAMKNII